MTRPRPKRLRRTNTGSNPIPKETLTADAVTVAWLVSCLFTWVGDGILIVLGTVLAAQFRDQRLLALAKLALLASVLFALTTLPLTYLAYRARRTAPPSGMIVAAVVGSLAPLAILAVVVTRSGL